MDMKHLEYLQNVSDEDVRRVKEKESTYKGSWKKRGGVGCFMMLCRKWDRLENMMEEDGSSGDLKAPPYDIFARIERDGVWHNKYKNCVGGPGNMAIDADGRCLAEVRDLRRYLLLLEAEMMARDVVNPPAVPKREIPTTPRPEFGKPYRPLVGADREDDPIVGVDKQQPGTPDDGGHHARQQIVDDIEDIEEQILASREARKPNAGRDFSHPELYGGRKP